MADLAEAVRRWAGAQTGRPYREDALRAVLHAARSAGLLDLPRPGAGATLQRWLALAEFCAADLSLGRLVEAHADAVAVLAELDGPSPDGLWGLWAAEPPDAQVQAERSGSGWLLTGRKAWCSGARILDRALVTARSTDGGRLFAVEVADLRPVGGTWSAVGLAQTGSFAVDLPGIRGIAVGAVGSYLERPGFWHGAAGVAACWYGGALGAGRMLLSRGARLEAHGRAHLGAVDAVLAGLGTELAAAAAGVDADPGDLAGDAELAARRLRARVEAGATEVLDRVGRALGPGPLCQDPVHAQRAADLPVYLRQSHAERDLAQLGGLAADRARW